MSKELARQADIETSTLEAIIISGDVSGLNPEQRIAYYQMRCEAAGLDPRTQPFAYIKLNGKLVLYATKTATEQLCEKRGLCVEIVTEGLVAGDLYRVQARVTGPDSRRSDNIGVVTVQNLRGADLANAMMKAVTKSYRRAVLSHCGLGMLDETEVETIPGATYPAPALMMAPVPSPAAPSTMTTTETASTPRHHPNVPTATLEQLTDYEQKRQMCIESGHTPPGTLSEGAPLWKLEKRLGTVTAILTEVEAIEVPPDDLETPEVSEPLEAVPSKTPEQKRLALLPIAAREKGLDWGNREARMEAVNTWLLDTDRHPVESTGALAVEQMDALIRAIKNGIVEW